MKFYAEIFGSNEIPSFFIEDRLGTTEFNRLVETAAELLRSDRRQSAVWVKTRMGMVGFSR